MVLYLAACYISLEELREAQDRDGDGFVSGEVGGPDCNDFDKAISPDAVEICGDDLDNDCDGNTDDVGEGNRTWFLDLDGDDYGVAGDTKEQCGRPPDYVAESGDCDDDAPLVNPGAKEACNDVDDDCDGDVDEGLTFEDWFVDEDGDGFGTGAAVNACEAPKDHVLDDGDCDDDAFLVNPGVTDDCDGVDSNCSGAVDSDATFVTWYDDTDDDGAGDPAVSQIACEQPSGFVDNADDCVPTDGSIVQFWFYEDFDGDGYGTDQGTAAQGCVSPNPDFFVDNIDDCNDIDEFVNPGEDETCGNGIDDNCDGDLAPCGITGTIALEDADEVATGVSINDKFGLFLWSLGDLNNDGRHDFVSADNQVGYRHMGSFRASVDLAVPTAETDFRVSAAGAFVDVTGGTASEWAVGDSLVDSIYVFDGDAIGQHSAAGAWATITGPSASLFGATVIHKGDFDCNGSVDLAAVAPQDSTGGIGAGAVYFLQPGIGNQSATSGFATITGEQDYDELYEFLPVDLDGDGCVDLATSRSAAAGEFPPGVVDLISGPFSGTISTAISDHRVSGILEHAVLRAHLAADLTGDGAEDLVLSDLGHLEATSPEFTAGINYVFSDPISASLTNPDARIAGEAGQFAGLTEAGDLDGDGFLDLVLGAPEPGVFNPGQVFVFYGPLAGSMTTLEADAVLVGAAANSGAGTSVLSVDHDGDGLDDLVIGSPSYNNAIGHLALIWGEGI